MSNVGLFPSGSTRVNSWGVDLYQVHQIPIHLSSSSNDIVFIVIDGDVFIVYCLFLLGNMDVGDELLIVRVFLTFQLMSQFAILVSQLSKILLLFSHGHVIVLSPYPYLFSIKVVNV